MRSLHTRGLLLPVALLLVVAAILVQGALEERGRERQLRTPAPAPAPPPAPALRPDLEKVPLAYLSEYWLQLGERSRSALALIGPERVPAIVVAPGRAVTSARALAGEGGERSFEVLGVDWDSDLAVVSPPDGTRPFRVADPAGLHPGALVAVVSLTPAARLRLLPGYLVAAGLELSVAIPPAFHAAAIVDLDGKLVGAAIESDSGMNLIPAGRLLEAAEALRGGSSCDAVVVGELDQAVAELLRVAGGVVVERVRARAFAGESPLQPGDILLEWDRKSVRSPEEFLRLYEAEPPGRLVPFVALRGRRHLAGGVAIPGPDCRPGGEPPLALTGWGLTLRFAGPEGGSGGGEWRIRDVEGGGPAADAGLEVGDVLLAVGGEDVRRVGARATIERLSTSAQGTVLAVRREGRVQLLVLKAEVP